MPLDLYPAEGASCVFCGDPQVLAIFEAWGHSFQLETCCETLFEQVCHLMSEDRAWAKDLLVSLDAETLFGSRIRRIVDYGPDLLLDFNLMVRPVAQARARSFISRHHRHCPPPAGWRWGAGAFNGHSLIGVVWVGRPVARRICQHTVVEVNRLCVRTDLPPPLVWNACSLLYGWAARQARSRGYRRIITYTLKGEDGGSLRAAGWTCEGEAGGGSWNRAGRPREDRASTERKIRWSRSFGSGQGR